MTAKITLEEFVKLLLHGYPAVVEDARNGVEGAFNYLVGMGIKFSKATVSIPEIETEIRKRLEALR